MSSRIIDKLAGLFLDHTGKVMFVGAILFCFGVGLACLAHGYTTDQPPKTDADKIMWAIYLVAVAIFIRPSADTGAIERRLDGIKEAVEARRKESRHG